MNDNFTFVLIVTIAEVYLTTLQSFMLLPTRDIGELVMSQFLYKKKATFGPPAPVSDNLYNFLTCYHRRMLLNNYSNFHASSYTGNRTISDFQFLYCSY